MTRVRNIFLLLTVSLCVFLFSSMDLYASVKKVEAEGLQVVVDYEWPDIGYGGYRPVRIKVHNLKEKREIVFQVDTSGEDFFLEKCSYTLSLNRGQKTEFTLSVPWYFNVTGHCRLDTYIDGKKIDPLTVNLDLGDYVNISYLVVDMSKPDFNNLENFYHRNSFSCEYLPADRLPHTWQSYIGLSRVWISFEVIKTMDDVKKRALVKWMNTGGSLHIYNCLPNENNMERIGPILFDGPIPAAVRKIPKSAKCGNCNKFHDEGKYPTYRCFDGFAGFLNFDPFYSCDEAWWLDQEGSRRGPRTGNPNFSRTNPRFFKIDMQSIPSGIFLLVTTIFILVIGPLNFFYFWKKKKLYMILFTCPLVAISTTLLLFLYALFNEGFYSRGTFNSMTVLDQTTKTASTTTNATFFAGVSPAEGLNFPRDYAISSFFHEGFDNSDHFYYSRYYRRRNKAPQAALQVNWGGNLNLSSSWIPARQTTRLQIKNFGNVRKRLVIEKPEIGRLKISNGLGTGIQFLVVRGFDGSFYSYNGHIGNGAILQSMEQVEHAEKLLPKLGEMALSNAYFRDMEKGTYIALLDNRVAGEIGLDDIRELKAKYWLKGYWEFGP